jgi:hypothetical protein
VRAYLSADDCDGGESLPEGTPAAAAVIAEDRARALDPVHQPDQAPHGRHLGRAPTSLFTGGSNKAAVVGGGERRDAVGSNGWEEMKLAATDLKKRACSFAWRWWGGYLSWTRSSKTGMGKLSH